MQGDGSIPPAFRAVRSEPARDEGRAPRRRLPSGDRGAGATEYMGMIIVVAAVIGVVSTTGFGQQISGKISAAICKVTGGSCAGSNQAGDPPKTDKDYEPPLCQISSITDKAGAKAKILFFEWGQEYGFQQQTFKANSDINGDGKVDDKDEQVMLTFTDAASIAAKKDWKPGMKVGKFGSDKVELGAGFKVTNGDTWVFKSEDEAKKFRDDLEKLKSYEYARTAPGGGDASVGNSILALFGKGPLVEEDKLHDKIEKALGNRHISYGKVGLEGSVSAGMKISAGDEKKLSASLGGNFKFSPEVTWTDNDFKGTKAYTYSASIEYGTKVGYEAGPLNGESSANTNQTGTITVTHDKKTGELVRIDMTRTVEKDAQKDGAKVKKGDNSGGVKGTDSQSGIRTVTNSVTFKPGAEGQHDRDIAQKWLDGGNTFGMPFTYMFNDHAPTKRPGNDDPFGQLLFDKGMSSVTNYTGQTNAAEYGFELNLGLSLGFSVNTEKKEQILNDAKFLGAPKGDQRAYVPYSYCAN